MRPRILAVDTSSARVSLAYFDGQRTFAFRSSGTARHSETLFLGIESLLKKRRARLADVDLFAVGLGPGSFTGLRVGVVAVKTLAYALGKKLCGISSFEAIAKENPKADWILIDAKRGNVFSARFGAERMIEPPAMRAVADFEARVRKGQRIAGPGLDPKAENLIPEALRRWDAGDFDDALKLAPQYLYDKTCTVVPPKPRKIGAR